MTTLAIQQTMMRIATIVAAAILAAFAASFAYVFFTGAAVTLAGLQHGILPAFGGGLSAVAILLDFSPVVLQFFFFGSFCLGLPTYLILRRVVKAGPSALAVAGALHAGLTASQVFAAFGPLAILPAPPAGAVGALVFWIVAERIP